MHKGSKITRTKILDMHVALWRDASVAIHCVTDECPLNHTPLSDGAAFAFAADGTTKREVIRFALFALLTSTVVYK